MTQDGPTVEDAERIETALVCILCCVKSRVIRVFCVVAPSLALLGVYLVTPSRPLPLFIAACVPPGLYLLTLCGLPGIVFYRQFVQDNFDAARAHRYLRGKSDKVACDVTDAPSTFPLCLEAAKTNDVPSMRWCLDKGQFPDEADHLGRTPLHWACFSGSDDVAEVLIKAGASLDLHDRLEGLAPLHYAAFYGHLKLTRIMVTNGADMEIENNHHMNPLQLTEAASLKTQTVLPAHPLIIKYLRTAMGEKATPPLEHTCGITVARLLEQH
ncbi:hypothetical protein SDRG_08199 [Saprolegnia diclina VS20]|uniref:Uncharacterized protein n=1 Tax=Saprolegnia diclina (strain VS20) TaxID=1156394 RepID=T0Q964_SAPDV|nr:hypothetical protein SDRG_08199 [Saprolegnia diclina VS20]EQC34429.1 hypothetical protein SDRG_08199 [Saprolegnia diclina VS20]|eukprot:XP_008612291.1 hypothetical protein SDRG_08199 [Saprolegnia diclina VS20]